MLSCAFPVGVMSLFTTVLDHHPDGGTLGREARSLKSYPSLEPLGGCCFWLHLLCFVMDGWEHFGGGGRAWVGLSLDLSHALGAWDEDVCSNIHS
jgi:hypothetical protein